MTDGDRGTPSKSWLLLIPILLTVAALLFGDNWFGRVFDSESEAAPTRSTAMNSVPAESAPAPSSSAATEPSISPEVASDLTESTVPTASADLVGQYWLADLQPRETEKEGRPGRCTDGCTGFKRGAGRIQGMVYPNSYLMEVAGDGRRSTALWNTARSCSALNMTLGLDDGSSSGTVTFTLSQDGSDPKTLAVVGLAEPKTVVNEPLVGSAQVEIAAYVSGPAVDDEVDLVLGDARITCAPGSLG